MVSKQGIRPGDKPEIVLSDSDVDDNLQANLHQRNVDEAVYSEVPPLAPPFYVDEAVYSEVPPLAPVLERVEKPKEVSQIARLLRGLHSSVLDMKAGKDNKIVVDQISEVAKQLKRANCDVSEYRDFFGLVHTCYHHLNLDEIDRDLTQTELRLIRLLNVLCARLFYNKTGNPELSLAIAYYNKETRGDVSILNYYLESPDFTKKGRPFSGWIVEKACSFLYQYDRKRTLEDFVKFIGPKRMLEAKGNSGKTFLMEVLSTEYINKKICTEILDVFPGGFSDSMKNLGPIYPDKNMNEAWNRQDDSGNTALLLLLKNKKINNERSLGFLQNLVFYFAANGADLAVKNHSGEMPEDYFCMGPNGLKVLKVIYEKVKGKL
ncbi:MAG: hypothetical protein COT85_02275 [Chlamydiae bacterium CG10_big_fil_rev_8_21_14_0_10_42_34]|nr:MAG: hypothetical protein COT85_02275 [Chlamydiae bacterium CG10_big_fil_rev_8_21_14_0_10_42_34]